MEKYFKAMQQTQKLLANRPTTRVKKLPSIPNPNVELVRSLTPKEESTAKSLVRLAHKDYKIMLDAGLKGNDPRLSSFRSNLSHVKSTLASHHKLSKQKKEQTVLRERFPERTETLNSIRGMINQAYQNEPDSKARGR